MTRHPNHLNRTLLRIGISVFLLTLFFLGFSHSAFAYTCPNPSTMVEWFQKSDVVFSGRLTKFNNKSYDLANFRVEKTWKGIPQKTIALHGWSRWGNAHQREKRYFVFANKSKIDGRFYQNKCSVISEAKLGSWKKRIDSWKWLALNLLAKGYDEKKFIEEILKIARTHKNITYRIGSIVFVLQFYDKDLGDGLKATKKTLQELRESLLKLLNSSDREISNAVYSALDRIPEIGYQSVSRYPCLIPLMPVKQYYYSKAVFMGSAIFIGKTRRGNKLLIVFKVGKSWKGVERKRVEVIFDEADQFQLGRQYLVYAGGGFPKFESDICGRTRIARNVELELILLDKLAEGMEEKKIFEWLLLTARTHHEEKTRLRALALVDSVFGVAAPDIPEGMESMIKKMAENPDYEHRQYAQTIFDKIQRAKENKKFLPEGN
jgi:hypothetical protein